MHQARGSVKATCLFYFYIGCSTVISYTRSPPNIVPPPSQPYTNDPVVLKPVYHFPDPYEQEPHKFWYENKPYPHRHGDQPEHEKRHQHFARYGDNEQFDNFITDPPGVGLNNYDKLSRSINSAEKDGNVDNGAKADAAVHKNPPRIQDRDLSPSSDDFFKSPPGEQPEPFPALSNTSVSSSSSGYGGYDSASGQGAEAGSEGALQGKVVDPEEDGRQRGTGAEENSRQRGPENSISQQKSSGNEENSRQSGPVDSISLQKSTGDEENSSKGGPEDNKWGENGKPSGPDDNIDQAKGSGRGGFSKKTGPVDDNQQPESKNVGLGQYSGPKNSSESSPTSGSGSSKPCCPCCGGGGGKGHGNGHSNGGSTGCRSPYCGPPKVFGTPPNCCAQAPLPCCLRLPTCCLPQLPCCPRIQIQCCPPEPVCCQPFSPCGVCRSAAHRALRTKRMGCLPCGRRKRRDVDAEDVHLRSKRMGCIPCLHKKRAKRQPFCQKCSVFGAKLVSRVKRSFSCQTCETKFERFKRQTEVADFYRGQTGQRGCVRCPGVSQSYFPSLLQSYRKAKKMVKRGTDENDYDLIFQCEKSCCDYKNCVSSKPLRNSESTSLPPISSLGKSKSGMLDVDLNEFDSSKWDKKKQHKEGEEEFLETSSSEPQ